MSIKKLRTGPYNYIWKGISSEERIRNAYYSEKLEVEEAKRKYVIKCTKWKKGDIVNGYRFVKSYQNFNLWEHLSKSGKPNWKAAYSKHETPALYDVEKYKDGDRSINDE